MLRGLGRTFAMLLMLCIGAAALMAATASAAPEGRAWEMVSPVDKNHGRIVPPVYSNADGTKVIYSSTAAFADSPSAARVNAYLGTRSESDWVAKGLNPEFDRPLIPNIAPMRGFTRDLTRFAVTTNAALTPGAPFSLGYNVYRHDLASGGYGLLTPVAPEAFDSLAYYPQFVAGNEDFSHMLLANEFPLTSDAPDNGNSTLYEWVDGELRVASILPSGEPVTGGANAGDASNADFFGFTYPYFAQDRNVISADGSRVFFTTDQRLYMRENGETTTRIGPDQTVVFERATEDGSRVFYVADGNLYRYDLDEDETTLISEDNEPADGTSGISAGTTSGSLVEMSDDGSVVYFVAPSQLEAGQTTEPGMKLYVWDGGSPKYITTLVGTTSSDMDNINWSKPGYDARSVTPEGDRLLFTSQLPLTGYDSDNDGKPCSILDNRARDTQCRQLFLYDRTDESLVCITCPAPGKPPVGDILDTPYTLLGASFTTRVPNLSTDGKSVVFDSPAPLLPEDSNGRYDVYQWQEGKGLELISSGRSQAHSFIVGASLDHSSIFFLTAERLVGQDVDGTYDLYVARVGGGIPSQNPQDPAKPCKGDDCQGPASQAPRPSSPGSAMVSGGVNDDRPAAGASIVGLRLPGADRKVLARGQRATVSVRVSGAGRVLLRARARIGRRGVLAGASAKRARGAGVVRLRLRLNRRAQQHLKRKGRLRLSLRARVASGRSSRAITLTLRQPRRVDGRNRLTEINR